MSRCTHRLVAEYLTATRRRPIPATYRPKGWHPGVYKLVCIACGHWLPLGTATDTPAALLELRAAELAHDPAAVFSMSIGGGSFWPACWGWKEHVTDGTPRDGEWVGWLAREIAQHPENVDDR